MKYVLQDDAGEVIERFVCPVDGCGFKTKSGPGAIRMHIVLEADPKVESRYNKEHEDFYAEHSDELTLDTVKELATYPIRRLGGKIN